ncbi:sensor histidine kinase [Nonomuraea sp. NPDC050556]|uniref:sensor histidine kinase n=1 Tax=Nonomuraea sp. NPDC050556 TaxID=3364369 RepID=UPI00378F938E
MRHREWALAVVFAAVLAFTAWRIAISWGPGYWVLDCAAGSVVCVLALLRGRNRAWAAFCGLAVACAAIATAWLAHLPAEPGPGMALALSVLIGSAVRVLPVRTAAAVGVFGLVMVAVPSSMTVPNGVAWVGGVGTGVALRLLALRREHLADTVRREERLQLARELHDVVAHHVSGIVLQSQATRVLARRRPEEVDGSLDGIENAGSEALSAMRTLVGLLRDDAPVRPERLEDLVGRFDGLPVLLRAGDGRDWPPEVTGTVYRVVRESLTNVARHASHAASVEVTVTQDGDAVVVEVVDDAEPRPSRRGGLRERLEARGAHGLRERGGFGVLGMRERVEALGGTLVAGPRPEGGWAVHASVPLP